MGVLDRFLNAMRLNDEDDYDDEDFLDDEIDDDYEEERPVKRRKLKKQKGTILMISTILTQMCSEK